jgi:flagellar hook assembly protein FlgD
VDIAVYNCAGKKVRQLFNGTRNPGYYAIGWNGQDDTGKPVSAGTYFFRYTLDGKTTFKQTARIR